MNHHASLPARTRQRATHGVGSVGHVNAQVGEERVAAGEDGQDLDRIHAPAMGGDQTVARLMRLRHGEGGAACAKPQGARRR